MEKRKMEKMGIETSLLGFGCMRFPVTADGRINEPEAEKMLDRAIAAGVNYIDTAYPYHDGASEPFVGKVLQKYDRSSFYLATKLPVWLVNTREDVDKYFEEQLQRLQTDYIDFYLMHAMGGERWKSMLEIGCVERLEELQAEGRIRHLGFSFHDSYAAFEEIIDYRDWDFCQIQLNYIDADDPETMNLYKKAEERHVPLVVMEPVRGGSLAACANDILEKFRAVDPTASPTSFALRWVGSLSNVRVILSGMSTMEQVEDNLATFEHFKPLSAMEKQTIDEIVAMMKSRIQNGCTGCRYCMPCPVGVDIPGSFRAWNTYHMYQNYNAASWLWENEIGEAHQPRHCVKCGKCEAACPQHLAIREDLVRAQADLDKREMILA